MDGLRLSWLGHPQVELRGRAVKLETRKATGLLAYLSLNEGGCGREKLATLFWGEASQGKALANLRRALASLNAALRGWIEADRETIGLKRGSGLWVDVEAFRQALSKLQEHQHGQGGECEDCLRLLHEAAGYYRGEFLEGLNLGDAPTFDEWQFFEKDGLRTGFGEVLERLAREYGERGEWEQALGSARRWVGLDRLNEKAWRVLMDLYQRSGQRAAAIHQYEELERLVGQQVGQRVEAETRALYERLRGAEGDQQVVEAGSVQPLLKTKLYIPSPPASRVNRKGLVERMGEVGQKALTLISAPAGFGKTTLLAEWIAQTDIPIAWISLDTGDNDPYRFLGYLVAALEEVQEGVGQEAGQMLRSSQLGPPQVLLASLINDLGGVREPVALVLDDYQFISEAGVHELMGYLLDHLPTNLHLVIATRADPPLPLGRLRAHGQLRELRTQDLRFNGEEAGEFLNKVMHLRLTGEDIRALEGRTEGWVVGLQMAALSLRGCENAGDFIRAFSGSHRYVLDYLVEEVLKRQPEHIQTFLLETSILEKLNGPLCEALMGEEWRSGGGQSGQAVLEELERRNLFLIPLDDQRQWYRYHHLFADLLQSRLRQDSTNKLNTLHAQASLWYERQGLFGEAIDHALLSGDFHRSANLLDTSSETRVLIDAFAVQKWIQQIPEEIICSHPWIRVSQAWIQLSQGNLEKIEDLLEQAEACIQDGKNLEMSKAEKEDIRGHIAMLKAYLAFFRGEPLVTIELACLALQKVRPSNNYLRSRIALQLGESYSVLGELSKGVQYLQEAVELSTRDRDYSVATVAYFRLGVILKVQGKLTEAERIYQTNLQALKELGGEKSPMRGKPEIGLGDVFRERGQLGAARELLSVGHRHSEVQGQPYDLVISFVHQARLLEAEGRDEQALRVLTDAEPLFLSSTNPPVIRQTFECFQVNLWIKLGMLDRVRQWIAANRLDDHTAITYGTEHQLMTLARLLMKEERRSEAIELLVRLVESTQAGGRTGRLIEILILLALNLHAVGKLQQALEILVKSLSLAEPEGYLRVFLDEGLPLCSLLKCLEIGKLSPRVGIYTSRILAAFHP